MTGPQAALLPGPRLHLQHGPIDLVITAEGSSGAPEAAFAAAWGRFAGLLAELCAELPALRSPADALVTGPVARRMRRAVLPYAARFITPMAAVAGAVADEILGAMLQAAPLRRAAVNNGGDIALHLGPGETLRVGMVDRPDQPGLFGAVAVGASDGVRGVATSGWRGRSFSLGIADAVTVLAADAATADAAATMIANAVDLPDHPGIHRVAAWDLQPDNDLGPRLVTRAVPPLSPAECASALAPGLAEAERLRQNGLILGAALHCAGATCIAAHPRLLQEDPAYA